MTKISRTNPPEKRNITNSQEKNQTATRPSVSIFGDFGLWDVTDGMIIRHPAVGTPNAISLQLYLHELNPRKCWYIMVVIHTVDTFAAPNYG